MWRDESGRGGAGVIAVLVIFVIVVAVGLLLFGGRLMNRGSQTNVTISVPSKK